MTLSYSSTGLSPKKKEKKRKERKEKERKEKIKKDKKSKVKRTKELVSASVYKYWQMAI